MRRWAKLIVLAVPLVLALLVWSRCSGGTPPAIPKPNAAGAVSISACTGEEDDYSTAVVLVRSGPVFRQERECLAVTSSARKRIIATLSSGIGAETTPRLMRVSAGQYTACGVPSTVGTTEEIPAAQVQCR